MASKLAEKLICNEDSIVLLSPTNNTVTREKVILYVIALLTAPLHESLSPKG